MFVFAFGILGLIVGSFLNVLILRYGNRSVGGRSACMSCGRTLLWYEMVPVLSWIALRAKCRTCGARISAQYPLIEGATGILFALVGASALSLPAQLAGSAVTALLIAIAVYDLRHSIIPDPWVYAFATLAFLSQAFFGPLRETGAFVLLSGPVVAAPLFALWFYSRGTWMGFGDVKLALGIGWLLGALYGAAALLVAFVLGAVAGLGLIAFTHMRSSSTTSRGFTIKSEIPFGPFLVAGTFIVWLMLLHNIDPLAVVLLSSGTTF